MRVCVFCLSPLPNVLCHFSFTITGTYALTSTLLKHTYTQCLSLGGGAPPCIACGAADVYCFSLLASLSLLPSFVHPFHSFSLSLTPPVILFIILSVPLHFQFVSSPPSSLPPTFLVLIRLHVSLIFLLLLHSPLPPSESLVITPLLFGLLLS